MPQGDQRTTIGFRAEGLNFGMTWHKEINEWPLDLEIQVLTWNMDISEHLYMKFS